MTKASRIDTTIEVVTPENIAFEYQLAGPFRRLPAYLIDVVIRWGGLGLVFFLLLIVSALTGMQILFAFTLAAFMVLTFIVNWFYGALLETFYNGRTVGKRFCGLRVISTDGRPLSATQAILRNLLRVADMAPYAAMSQLNPEIPEVMFIPTGIIGLASVMLTRRMQRLGDLAAGTMVVIDEPSWRVPVAKVDDRRVVALDQFVPAHFRVSQTLSRTLASYAERRGQLAPARRREVARHLADPLIDRFAFRRDIDPDLLLYALYYRTYLWDERAEPEPLGELAGYSPLARDAERLPPTPVPVAAERLEEES
jgi:uncharacterized RDD family membrane protein YckC